MEGTSFYPINVSKAWTERRKGVKHHKKTKKKWMVYGYMKDYDGEFHFTSFRINIIQALYYKLNKCKNVKILCAICGDISRYLIKNNICPKECSNCGEKSYKLMTDYKCKCDDNRIILHNSRWDIDRKCNVCDEDLDFSDSTTRNLYRFGY